MTLNGVMALTLRYFTEFDNSLLYYVVRVRCRRKKVHFRSHLLMNFLLLPVLVLIKRPRP